MDVKEIGNRIKQARILRNYVLDDIANEIGVAKSTIQRYENGLIRKPKLPVLQVIADSLKVNPAWICGKDVPMDVEDSLADILKRRLAELNMTLEEVSQKSGVPLHWLQNIDTFVPGELGDYEIGYDWITKVAKVIGMSSATLRSALAQQEIPAYEGDESEYTIEQAREDFAPPMPDPEFDLPPDIRAAARGMMTLSDEDKKTALDMINFLSQKGKEAKDS